MNLSVFFFLLLTSVGFSQREKLNQAITPLPKKNDAKPLASNSQSKFGKDKVIERLIRYFEQADAIHREAWWVLSNEKRSPGRSPFGKVQRAFLSSQKMRLSNKSMFRCDRYLIKKQTLGLGGNPLSVEVFENCNPRQAPKLFAKVLETKEKQVQVSFFPENLEEILGLGPSVINRTIRCEFFANDSAQVDKMSCVDWAQDRSKEQMIRLDLYDYDRLGKTLIKMRGKVFENLSDTRKIVADVPAEGKIEVVETELYPPPDEKPKLKPVIPTAPSPVPSPLEPANENAAEIPPEGEQGQVQHAESGVVTPLPSPREQGGDTSSEEKGVIYGR